jgi:hypothetical protein
MHVPTAPYPVADADADARRHRDDPSDPVRDGVAHAFAEPDARRADLHGRRDRGDGH